MWSGLADIEQGHHGLWLRRREHPMYLEGADHPSKHRARTLVETTVSQGDALVTDVEALQEMLHRCGALRSTDAVRPVG